jgi:hypothetical protein
VERGLGLVEDQERRGTRRVQRSQEREVLERAIRELARAEASQEAGHTQAELEAVALDAQVE